MSSFFDDQPLNGETIPSTWELAARMFPPADYADCVVVQIGEHCVWRREDELTDDDLICFYDGDCRNVLLPDDPRLKK